MVHLDSTRPTDDDLAGQAFAGEVIYPHNINSREIAALKRSQESRVWSCYGGGGCFET